MEIKSSKDIPVEPRLKMLVYGKPGTGKTTFAAKSDKVLIADVESGTTMLGLHGIECDIVHLTSWADINELYEVAKSGKYATIVIDPVGELLDKLLEHLKLSGHAQAGGEVLSIQGWGIAKTKFRKAMRNFRDLPCNVIFVAHTAEHKGDDTMTVRPKLAASLDEDLCAMVDVVGYLHVTKTKEGYEREMFIEPTDKYYAKDRFGLIEGGKIASPTFDVVRSLADAKAAFHLAKKADAAVVEFEKDLN